MPRRGLQNLRYLVFTMIFTVWWFLKVALIRSYLHPHEKQNKKKIVCFEYRELPINISLAAHNNLLLLILNSTK